MKRSELSDLKKRVSQAVRQSSLGKRLKGVTLEADQDGGGDDFLSILVKVQTLEKVSDKDIRAAVELIEKTVGELGRPIPQRSLCRRCLMARFEDELLAVASRLIRRRPGQRGKLSSAQIRRSISTSYYALVHFLLSEAGTRLVGSRNDLRRRRQILARAFTHRGIRTALEKVGGETVDCISRRFPAFSSCRIRSGFDPSFRTRRCKGFFGRSRKATWCRLRPQQTLQRD